MSVTLTTILAIAARLAAALISMHMAQKKGQNVWARGGLTAVFPVFGMLLGAFGQNKAVVSDLGVTPTTAKEAADLLIECRQNRAETVEKVNRIRERMENTDNPVLKWVHRERLAVAERKLAVCDANIEAANGFCREFGVGISTPVIPTRESDGEKMMKGRNGEKMLNALEHVIDLAKSEKKGKGFRITDLLGK